LIVSGKKIFPKISKLQEAEERAVPVIFVPLTCQVGSQSEMSQIVVMGMVQMLTMTSWICRMDGIGTRDVG
jgi:hypothetical protein